MNKKDFFLRLQEDLELEIEVNGETNIKDLDEWDSMAAMVLIGLVNEEFSITLNSDDIENITTVNSLIERIGINKFN
ncbi:MAG: acyl carrier protein [Flavobacterium sp.]|uniref:acyl carrier protein n=1 Tax=Flavobacterium sp. TaxID=239 RepID=UPI001B27D941|nr:acyl carrier protein [Flavobacterium sp.]MBO9585946.1 acyl carrier protein [Flavobacterium sp.]